jgi:hypothetical protein
LISAIGAVARLPLWAAGLGMVILAAGFWHVHRPPAGVQ